MIPDAGWAAAIVAKDHIKVQFLIVGEGKLRPECESLINELNLADRFFLLGYRNDINKILLILTTMSVLSSLWEGLPVVFLAEEHLEIVAAAAFSDLTQRASWLEEAT